ncbi:hypothetical protein ACFL1O_00570 [Patescibacteria group bacterium]
MKFEEIEEEGVYYFFHDKGRCRFLGRVKEVRPAHKGNHGVVYFKGEVVFHRITYLDGSSADFDSDFEAYVSFDDVEQKCNFNEKI